MPRFIYQPHPHDPVETATLGVAFSAGVPAEVSEDAAVILRGNPWFVEVTAPAVDADGDGVETVAELRAALDAAGVEYDRRWGAARLRAALEGAG